MSVIKRRSRGVPCLIGADAGFADLERLTLGSGLHSEAWLQELVHLRPDLLPISQIEPGFGMPVPVAREIDCGHGFIDNLFVTPSGELILVEAKLWANLQARREVVAQALDYVAALMQLSYAAFEQAIAKCPNGPSSLYALVSDHPDALSEAEFIDAVSRNLSRGRMLVIVLGDGIRREAEALGQLLQSHAGAHFTFAMVELQVCRNKVSGDLLIVPDTLAQTVMIERGIVRLEHGQMQVVPVPAEQQTKAASISEVEFFERLAKRSPALPQHVRSFLALVEPLGVYAGLKASLNLKVDLADAPKPLNLGYIDKTGKLWTNPAKWSSRTEAYKAYNETLAALIGGQVSSNGNELCLTTTNGTSAPVIEQLLPAHAEAWKAAIAAFVTAEQSSIASL